MKNRKDFITYLIIAALIILARLSLVISPVDHPLVKQSIFSWTWIICLLAGGAAALLLSSHAGFPTIWERGIRNKHRFGIPLLAGTVFFAVQLPISLALKIPNIHIPFPHSLPVYMMFAGLLEIFFHLIPIAVIVWVSSTLVFRRKWSDEIFWIGALLISLYEPLTQIGGLKAMGILPNLFWAVIMFAFIYLANLVPLFLFRRYGFMGNLVFRLTFYSLWHIIWPLIWF